VATFLPGEGVNRHDLRWKFDVAGIYDYKGCNRIAAYMLVRRIQTLWPERPIIWLSLGIGGYEMNPVKYHQRTPQSPMFTRNPRAYADSVSAWLAGADAGWFSVWIFVEHDFAGSMGALRGVQVNMEDITPDGARVKQGIEYAFRGVDELKRLKNLEKPELNVDMGEAVDDDIANLQLEEPVEISDGVEEGIAEEKARMLDGFLYYRRYVHDCGRVFASLPRMRYTAPALCVRPGISVWTRGTTYPIIPGFALLSAFDFLCDVNKAAEMGDLSRYRLIALHEPGRLTDRTIESLSAWVHDTPGLLYVHGALSADNSAEVSTIGNMDGRLERDWPWEPDVRITLAEPAPPGRQEPGAALTLRRGDRDLPVSHAAVRATYDIGGAARAVLTLDGTPVLAVWRGEGAKGAVLFDGLSYASADYLAALRDVMNQLHEAGGIGMKIDGPFLEQALRVPPISAAARSPYYSGAASSNTLHGLDLLTGERDPVVGPGRSGAIVADEFDGTYAATHDGVTILSDEPLAGAHRIDGGFLLPSARVIRAACANGIPRVEANGGSALPEVEALSPWLLHGSEDGIAVVPTGREDAAQRVVYVRSARPVRILAP
jgi:hypothetical protein